MIQHVLLLAKCASCKTLEALFPAQKNRNTIVAKWYIYARDRRILRLQTDGACPDNSQTNPRAGTAYVFAPPGPEKSAATGVSSITLKPSNATSDRAEFIAVITALRARLWLGEGFYTVIIVTDSEYVAKGCTEWCTAWEARGWKTSKGRPMKNRDLWEELVYAIEWLCRRGCKVRFWQIPREWNGKADGVAKRAAETARL